MADSSLEAIRIKVRRLTRSQSPAQITDTEIDEYINTFILFDMPENLYLFSNKTTFTFYTEPYVDEYDSDNPATQLDDFKNKYTTFEAPVYIAGQLVPFYQNREDFYAAYPYETTLNFLAYGDGLTTNFSGTLASFPILKNNNLFSSIDANNNSLELHDFVGGAGTTALLGGSGIGTINYVTGEYDLDFSVAPASGVAINSQTRPYLASKPQALLYFNNKFYVRPVPDQAYRVDIEAFKLPTELLSNSQSPDLDQWSQYIAHGAAIKVYQDRMDIDSVALLMPEFKKQEILVNRRNVNQQSRSKVNTVFNSGVALNRSPFSR